MLDTVGAAELEELLLEDNEDEDEDEDEEERDEDEEDDVDEGTAGEELDDDPLPGTA